MEMSKGRYLNDFSKYDLSVHDDTPEDVKRGEAIRMPEEVIRIHANFFEKPPYKQRATLRLLMWWSIKHYFKILFK